MNDLVLESLRLNLERAEKEKLDLEKKISDLKRVINEQVQGE